MRAWLSFALVAYAGAQSLPPDPASQKAIIERTREAAMSYGDRLQDFTCTQITARSTDRESNGKHWSPLDTLEHEVDYVARVDHHRLVKVNGKSSNLEKRVKQGYFTPGGEFGSRLRKIFEPNAQAEFTWDHAEQIAGRSACVFRYHVAEATSTLAMQVNDQAVRMGHHGLVHADCETGSVLRIEMETEPAWARLGGKPAAVGAQIDVRYGLTSISGRDFLVPLEATEIARFDKKLTKAEIKFQKYRKYDADSSIKFETGEGKQE
jgi:hypothetical protein